MATIKERLATLETQVTALMKVQWVLVTAILTQVGVRLAPL